jgi:hypothetical protein
MPDQETAFAFRAEMHKKMNIPQLLAPPLKVLFMLRGNNRRKIENLDALFKIVESYNLTYTYVACGCGSEEVCVFVRVRVLLGTSRCWPFSPHPRVPAHVSLPV